MNSKHLLAVLIAILIVSCNIKPDSQAGLYFKKKKYFHTNLITKGEAPQEYENLESTDDAIKVMYPSNGINLQGMIVKKNIDSTKRKPVVVFLHGGFALGEQDWLDCNTFTEQGFIVFTPSYRAENGNGGYFELMYGEIDDAAAAVKWIAKQPFVDSTKIYVFGHSIGGGLSAMLSLEQNLPIAKSGSCGGIYDEAFFQSFGNEAPFDLRNPKEIEMRLFTEHLNSMQIEHYAFIGKGDTYFYRRHKLLDMLSENTKLKLFYTEGSHMGSLEPSIKMFIDLIHQDK